MNIRAVLGFLAILGAILLLVWLAKSYGQTATVGTTAQVSCGNAAATLALAASPTRRSFTAVAPVANTAIVYVGFGTTLTTANGIALSPGAALNDSTYLGAVYCRVAAGAQPLHVGETRR